ncbi:hypothetical protein [Pedobacter panaciterrae]
MKLVSYKTEDREHLGVFVNGHIYNLNSCDKQLPDEMNAFLQGGEVLMDRAKKVDSQIKSGELSPKQEAFLNCLLRYLIQPRAEMVMHFVSMWLLPEEIVKLI